MPSTHHSPSSIEYREARLEDFEQIYAIFCDILEDGTTYSYTLEEMTPDRSLAYWISAPGTHCIVAECDGQIAAVTAVRPNRTGRGGHVANASFIVNKDFRRRGIARELGQKAINWAKEQGYQSMQFNFVVSINEVAVNLWKSLGFEVVGTLPKGFNHAKEGLVDVYIMSREL